MTSYAAVHRDDPDPGVVMGYHDAADLPVYDHLARHFCVCDRWFSSVPGATWPNRLYAVAGRADGSRDNRRPLPMYDLPAFTRHLDRSGVSWRWYSHDPGTLHLVDARYRLGPDRGFAFFDRRTLFEPRHFLDDAAAGTLPAVSWIDPNFVDLSGFGPPCSNDDHPPSDVMAGQALVLKAFNAVVHGRRWDRTLLLVVYDEHGGFYDHVAAPAAPDGDPAFRRYGVRVPALVVSPHVRPGSVSSVVFDHASIVKTILLRFCRDAAGAIPAMGTRVARANHLGQALSDGGPFPAPPEPELQAVVDRTADWAADAFRRELAGQAAARHAGADDPSDLQREIIETARVLRAAGLRPGRA